MFSMLLQGSEVIGSVNGSVEVILASGWIRFIDHIARFLFLGLRAMEFGGESCTVACVWKNHPS